MLIKKHTFLIIICSIKDLKAKYFDYVNKCATSDFIKNNVLYFILNFYSVKTEANRWSENKNEKKEN